MILSLFPVSNNTLPLGCMTTKKPTGTWMVSVGPRFCRTFFPMVSAPELKTYSFIPCGDCAIAAVAAKNSPTTTIAAHHCLMRLISYLLLQVKVRNRAKATASLRPLYVVAVPCQLKKGAREAYPQARLSTVVA